MASVSSLDKDLRRLRLDKYTPQAATEARSWIESTLNERLSSGDLLEGLKDGVALCKLINMAIGPPGVRFKKSNMPFVQMENISLFLRACKCPPLNLQEHDVFLTVDLYESKDPAQVLQCLCAFSRAANAINPSDFPSAIGPRNNRPASVIMSPQSTGQPAAPLRGRGLSNASNLSGMSSSTIGIGSRHTLVPSKTGDSASGRWSPTKTSKNGDSTSPVTSSWSRREHEGATSPAWNIAQYGYMGGASQGNLGIAFGGRRQITSAGPHVPNAAEKARRRKQQEAEEERLRLEKEEEEERRQLVEVEALEERARLDEERRWAEETERAREKQEQEKRKWEEEERQWKITEEKRRREEEAAEAKIAQDRRRARSRSRDPPLQGQYLSQYQAEQGIGGSGGSKYSSRVRELEKELELARQRETEYQARRATPKPGDQPNRPSSKSGRARSRSRPRLPVRNDSWSKDEREVLRTPRHLSPVESDFAERDLPPKSPRPLPDPSAFSPPPRLEQQRTGGRPLPDPATVAKTHHTGSRPLPEVTKQHTGSRPLPEVTKQHTGTRPLPQAPTPQSTSRQQPAPPSPQRESRRMPSPQPPRRMPSPQPPPRKVPTPQPLPRQRQPEIISPQPSRVNRPFAKSPAPQSSSSPGVDKYGRPIAPQNDDAEWDEPQEPRRLPRQPPQQQPQPKENPYKPQPQPPAQAKPWHQKPLQKENNPKPTPKPKPAGMSLLEREMENERLRQQEWEDEQKETASRARPEDGGVPDGVGGGVGGRWDVGQWAGYTGGDGGNKGSAGIGGGRRQIVGPRPLAGPRPLPGHR